MPVVFEQNESAIRRGIKLAGVGRKGSRTLDVELVRAIIQDIRSGRVTEAAKGAFFAGLLFKGIEGPEEEFAVLFSDAWNKPHPMAQALAPRAPDNICALAGRLLAKEEITEAEAYRLGRYMMTPDADQGLCGLVASSLRVRYETPDEYAGLLAAMNETLEPSFRTAVPQGEPIVQIAEPFDGVDKSYMITPLIGKFIQGRGYRVVHMTGRNSGPKLIFNTLDLFNNLGVASVKSNAELGEKKPEFGWVLNQQYLSRPLDAWVDIRRETVKRPFLATLEKFLNPAHADILITSAFHPPYGEKMMTVAERAGFPACIVIRNGMEGSCAFGLLRAAKILCSVRRGDTYLRHEITIEPGEYLDEPFSVEERLERPVLIENVELVRRYQKEGSTGNRWFDARVKVTTAGLKAALDWIEEHRG